MKTDVLQTVRLDLLFAESKVVELGTPVFQKYYFWQERVFKWKWTESESF